MTYLAPINGHESDQYISHGFEFWPRVKIQNIKKTFWVPFFLWGFRVFTWKKRGGDRGWEDRIPKGPLDLGSSNFFSVGDFYYFWIVTYLVQIDVSHIQFGKQSEAKRRTSQQSFLARYTRLIGLWESDWRVHISPDNIVIISLSRSTNFISLFLQGTHTSFLNQ